MFAQVPQLARPQFLKHHHRPLTKERRHFAHILSLPKQSKVHGMPKNNWKANSLKSSCPKTAKS
jgi:hypothetical protein